MSNCRLTADTRVVRSPELLSAPLNEETVLMSMERNRYYGIAGTAQDIWQRLEQPVTLAELCRSLTDSYAGDPKRIAEEAGAFLERLLDEGMIVREE